MKEEKATKNKLIRVERVIVLYNKKWEKPLKEFNLDNIPLNKIREIVTPKEDDDLLYDGYVLDLAQLEAMNKFMYNKIEINMDLYNYVLECNGIYD